MAKGKKEISCEVVENIAVLKEYNGDYVKKVMRCIWNDNPVTLDIRSVNEKTGFVGKGISLSDEEADNLVNALIDVGYGSTEKMKAAIVREMKRTNIGIEGIEDCDDIMNCVYEEEDGTKTVEIPMYG